MRYMLYCIILYCTLGGNAVHAQENLLHKGKGQRPKITEQRGSSGINPFEAAARVELLHYNDRMAWWPKRNPDGRELVKDGKLTFPQDSILERTIVSPELRKEWDSLLYEQHLCEESMVAGCYEPRHLLVFYKSDGGVLGCIELCVTCSGGYISPGLRPVIFCPRRTSALQFWLVKTLGHAYYDALY